jgi:hypothetical protein
LRAYRRFRKRSSLKYCVYLTGEERSALVAELEFCEHRAARPVMSTLLRHLKSPREDGIQ